MVQNWCTSNLESYALVKEKISGQLNVKHLAKVTLKIQCTLVLYGKVCVLFHPWNCFYSMDGTNLSQREDITSIQVTKRW